MTVPIRFNTHQNFHLLKKTSDVSIFERIIRRRSSGPCVIKVFLQLQHFMIVCKNNAGSAGSHSLTSHRVEIKHTLVKASINNDLSF